ncbi:MULTISPECIES: hypothetical protein [unclassified Methylophilus]|uniref:hypothetical protein n=1 Tax=unclassified Methylophilus TaxID=2630143 RepID=UPI0006FAD55D|nr:MULTISPECIES: hypothetical protein [unclassified Methylophilus]KQT42609.1 acetyltransferase [Methylophilus sp. Leaf416]KQT56794.1 acetyltransferase [Methylophilus sp. Leaf459]
MRNLTYCEFGDVDLGDKFFDSLKADYPKFVGWFNTKAASKEKAYVFYRIKDNIDGFLYLKIEEGEVNEVIPPLPNGKHLKVGTLKINAHGTKLGERFIKKLLDYAVLQDVDDIYVTVFEKHAPLIDLLTRYGFVQVGIKKNDQGEEIVLVRDMSVTSGDILKDYPFILPNQGDPYLLAIWPKYHTKFLPDSKLNNESFDILEDVSHTNSIHKVYISGIPATGKLKQGDILVLYRTTDKSGKAYFRSVATSICVVQETRKVNSFGTFKEFIKYVKPYSVFSHEELNEYYTKKAKYNVIKFTYNAALVKRVIRKLLLEEVAVSVQPRWDFRKLSNKQLEKIISIGSLDENFIVD